MRRTARTDAALAAAAGAAAALAGWAAWIEPRRLVTRSVTLRLPRWPAGLDGMLLVLVSDLHAGSPQIGPEAIRRVVRRVNNLQPDLIAILGDIVDPKVAGANPVSPSAAGRALSALRAPLGVIGVLGNHDWANDGPGVLLALRAAGVRVLENEAVSVSHCGTVLHVAGVADATTRLPEVHRALRELPPGEPVLLLSHDPDVFPQVPPRVSLTVSGHTHGGQVDLPLLRRLVIPSRYGDRYASGHVVEDGRHLYVTSGIGTSRWPIRLRRPPEVVALRLRSAG